MKKRLIRLLVDRSGATAIEYGLLVGLIAGAIVTTTAVIENHLGLAYEDVASTLTEELD